MPQVVSNLDLNNQSRAENALDSVNGKDYVTQDELPVLNTTEIQYRKEYTCEDNSTGNGRLSWGNGSTNVASGALITEDATIVEISVSTSTSASNQNINIEVNGVVVGSVTHNGLRGSYPVNIAVLKDDQLNLNRTSNAGGGIITATISVESNVDVSLFNGAQGEQGIQGEPGLDGNSIITGGSLPPVDPAPLQAAYIQTNGDIYLSENTNSWTFLTSIMGTVVTTAKYTNTAVGNVNTNGTFSGINTTALFDQIGSSISVTNNLITFLASGTYEVYFNLYQTGTATRSNVGIEYSLNGTPTGRRSASSYIRNASGHNEASTNLKETFVVATNDTIAINTLQLAGGGTVSAPVGASLLEIRKLS